MLNNPVPVRDTSWGCYKHPCQREFCNKQNSFSLNCVRELVENNHEKEQKRQRFKGSGEEMLDVKI